MYQNLKGKRLLILGGIAPMVEVVERCHELGIEVYVTDYLKNSPAKKNADKSFMVSTTDIDAVVKLCRDECIDGIYTGNVDSMLPYYAQICSEMNFPCYGNLETFQIMIDKKQFKAICSEYGVPIVDDYQESDIDEGNLFYPIIIKPVDSSGSRGISIVRSQKELDFGIEKALSYSPSKKYIVERYMESEELVLYYYLQDGNPVFATMCDRYVNKQQKNVAQLPTAYIFPSKYTDSHLEHSDKLIKKMLRKIGLTNGPIFLQAFVDKKVPHLYEPGYRTNGAREQYIVEAVSGVSSVDMLIHFALTGKMSEEDISDLIDPYLKGKYACKLSPLIGKGTISNIKGVDAIRNMPSVVKVVLNNDIGDSINDEKLGTLKQIAYRAFIVEDTIEDLKKTIDYIQNKVDYYDEEGKSMLLEMFDTNILLSDYK